MHTNRVGTDGRPIREVDVGNMPFTEQQRLKVKLSPFNDIRFCDRCHKLLSEHDDGECPITLGDF